MPGIKCRCNNIIKTSKIPNPNELLFIHDEEYDLYEGMIDSDELYAKMKRILVCNKCNRMWVYWKGYDHLPISYVREDPSDST